MFLHKKGAWCYYDRAGIKPKNIIIINSWNLLVEVSCGVHNHQTQMWEMRLINHTYSLRWYIHIYSIL